MTDVTPATEGAEPGPERVGELSLQYVDGVPVLTVVGETAIPTNLAVKYNGQVVAAYTATPLHAIVDPETEDPLFIVGNMDMKLPVMPWQIPGSSPSETDDGLEFNVKL
ncbi:hypothetical protein ACFV0B_09010 [Streptomyces xanthophaeus]|uniref:hypothetical protein n=1 Tax=Streptomyces xanthophaeus TaxID=67385 RepID=UPI00368791F8